jgi:hypothetical protein
MEGSSPAPARETRASKGDVNSERKNRRRSGSRPGEDGGRRGNHHRAAAGVDRSSPERSAAHISRRVNDDKDDAIVVDDRRSSRRRDRTPPAEPHRSSKRGRPPLRTPSPRSRSHSSGGSSQSSSRRHRGRRRSKRHNRPKRKREHRSSKKRRGNKRSSSTSTSSSSSSSRSSTSSHDRRRKRRTGIVSNDDDNNNRDDAGDKAASTLHHNKKAAVVAPAIDPRQQHISSHTNHGEGNNAPQTPTRPKDPSFTPKKQPPLLPPPPSSTGHKKKVTATTTTKRGDSAPRDDTVGHFEGQQGAMITDRFKIIREVGLGTFGRVLECLDMRRTDPPHNPHVAQYHHHQHHRGGGGGGGADLAAFVAIKMVRKVKRYRDAALVETRIIQDINRQGGRGLSHCVQLRDSFDFGGHYCLVFESLGPSLHDFLKMNKYRGFPMVCVQDFAVQLLEAVDFLYSMRIIHTDLKIGMYLLSLSLLFRKTKCGHPLTLYLVGDFAFVCWLR